MIPSYAPRLQTTARFLPASERARRSCHSPSWPRQAGLAWRATPIRTAAPPLGSIMPWKQRAITWRPATFAAPSVTSCCWTPS
jgi:hypothetical protein